MKSKTIWESASRPLFVRSVWLESPHDGRGVQHRHFILDHESQRHVQERGQKLCSVSSPARAWGRKESLKHSISCDISELSESDQSQLTAVNFLQIGSAKIKLQQPISQQARQQLKLLKFYRRPSLTKQTRLHKQADNLEYECNLKWRMRELQEIYSRHSSLQDLQSTLSMSNMNPEDRLAERVLNWLDLAGKSALVKSVDENELPAEAMLMENITQSCEKHANYKQHNQQQHLQHQRRKLLPQQQQNQQHFHGKMPIKKRIRNNLSRHCHEHQNLQQGKPKRQQRDAVKPITIIFNRDGFPVRLNRAARNIDLCTLASSAGTTRRMAGSLASARLYNGNETNSYKPPRAAEPNVSQRRTSSISRQRHGAEMERSNHAGNQQNFDSKRQLHIFMPSLPKKGMTSTSPSLLSAAGVGDEVTMNLLSQKLNENCKL